MISKKNEIKCFNCAKRRNKTDDYFNCRLKCSYKYKKEQESDKKEIAYLKECCINAGKELSKHSFEWDGKEKNLVVQALYLNEKYEKLQSALKGIKEILKFYADTWVDEKIYPNLHFDNTKAKEGLSKINEVIE